MKKNLHRKITKLDALKAVMVVIVLLTSVYIIELFKLNADDGGFKIRIAVLAIFIIGVNIARVLYKKRINTNNKK